MAPPPGAGAAAAAGCPNMLLGAAAPGVAKLPPKEKGLAAGALAAGVAPNRDGAAAAGCAPKADGCACCGWEKAKEKPPAAELDAPKRPAAHVWEGVKRLN